jgi:hypothetical protein
MRPESYPAQRGAKLARPLRLRFRAGSVGAGFFSVSSRRVARKRVLTHSLLELEIAARGQECPRHTIFIAV